MEAPACEGGTCQLFGRFGIFVQLLIGAWCLLTLVVLWRCEAADKRRPFLTWLGDMSKQLVGAAWGHFMNVFLALFVGNELEGGSTLNNQCVWYLMGFLSDILVVTFLCWWATSAARPLIRRKCGIDIGDYDQSDLHSPSPDGVAVVKGVPPWAMWCIQTGIWLAIMTAVKVVVSVAMFSAQSHLYRWLAMAFQYGGLCHHARAQLITSVIIVPVIGDAFQLAVQDGFLKRPDVEVEAMKPLKGDVASDEGSTESDSSSEFSDARRREFA
mmetsp:Transcript_15838/g.43972  ORF Transcript_15838/g.43972 Transcript_15838/m.43972 type:complete len:270 (-) Transcript_15838:237-1046(-)